MKPPEFSHLRESVAPSPVVSEAGKVFGLAVQQPAARPEVRIKSLCRKTPLGLPFNGYPLMLSMYSTSKLKASSHTGLSRLRHMSHLPDGHLDWYTEAT